MIGLPTVYMHWTEEIVTIEPKISGKKPIICKVTYYSTLESFAAPMFFMCITNDQDDNITWDKFPQKWESALAGHLVTYDYGETYTNYGVPRVKIQISADSIMEFLLLSDKKESIKEYPFPMYKLGEI